MASAIGDLFCENLSRDAEVREEKGDLGHWDAHNHALNVLNVRWVQINRPEDNARLISFLTSSLDCRENLKTMTVKNTTREQTPRILTLYDERHESRLYLLLLNKD